MREIRKLACYVEKKGKACFSVACSFNAMIFISRTVNITRPESVF